PGIFSGDALGYGLGALELRGGVEIDALLAAVQLERAPRALPVGVEIGLQHRSAIGAAGAGDGSHHARRARTDLFLTGAILRRASFFFLGALVFLIAPMAILPLQTYSSTQRDSHQLKIFRGS